MHDCRQTQDSLIDVLFDEADSAERSRLFAEVERCAACAAQYRSFNATLDACDEAADALAPDENYWPQYHASLTRRLLGAAGHAPSRTPFWKHLLTTSIRVPAPLAAAAALLLVATSIFTLALVARPAPEPVVLAAPNTGQPEAAPQIKFIEVPVVREKIVTQTIYLPRRGEGDTRRFAPRDNLAAVGRQDASPAPVANTPTPRANLSGFEPAGEVNRRIIKGSNAREQ
jgi:anti-sigma factor RsiW